MSIHCANPRTNQVGTLYDMLDRVSAVWGAFASDSGSYNVWSLSVGDYRTHMRPTPSKGPSRGKVGLVERSVFERLGNLIAGSIQI